MSARPKRPNEPVAGVPPPAEPSSKKPRFDYRNPSTLAADAPEEDAILDLDEIGVGNTTKRNAVNLDGYDSDSDNDNFNERANAKARAQAKAAKSKDEEDADMFADLEEADGDEDEDLAVEGKKKKDVRFLEEDEIVGQVADSKSGGHVSSDFSLGNGKSKAKVEDDESSSDEGDDELRDFVPDDVNEELGAGAKKKHAPKLDAFNMRSENEEGRFDETGNYIRKANDPEGRHDLWLEGVSKKDMKKAKDAADKREEERRAKNRADDALLTSDLLSALIRKLDKGETTLEALARLGRGAPKKKPKWANKNKNKKQNADEDMDIDATEDPAETQRKATVEEITEAADQLLTRGQVEIYDQEREILMRQYRRETGEDWKDPAAQNDDDDEEPKTWEYRWADGREGEVIHGPYDGLTMRAWNEAGYFLEGVEFRANGSGDWLSSVDF
ncbi:hypothetical protein Vi05172_g7307 [Venturia inaequalis]|nr:hypothetical protein Vi05172_g7307 [Venturia inaequalis]